MTRLHNKIRQVYNKLFFTFKQLSLTKLYRENWRSDPVASFGIMFYSAAIDVKQIEDFVREYPEIRFIGVQSSTQFCNQVTVNYPNLVHLKKQQDCLFNQSAVLLLVSYVIKTN